MTVIAMMMVLARVMFWRCPPMPPVAVVIRTLGLVMAMVIGPTIVPVSIVPSVILPMLTVRMSAI